MLQADDEDDLLEERMRSPFGSSFRTFNATDYKPIGKSKRAANSFVWRFEGLLKVCLVTFASLFACVRKQTAISCSDQSTGVGFNSDLSSSIISHSVCGCLTCYCSAVLALFPFFFLSKA